jgi:hypothetical protein
MRFSLKRALLGLTAACAWLTIFKLAGGVWAFVLLNGLVFFSLCNVTLDRPRQTIAWVLPLQTVLLLCLAVLVASYHINGRAWHDYGGSWNPPPYLDEHGAVVAVNVDYDPKNTRPYMWPWIGEVMSFLSLAAMASMIIPPTAPLCTFVLLMLLRTHSTYPKAIRVAARTQIYVASALMIYLAFWGLKILEWLGD